MVMLDVDRGADRLRVRFTTTERLLGGVPDIDVPLAAVSSVDRLPDPWAAVRDMRFGVGVRGLWLLGTGHRQLIALRRDRPAVRITLRDDRYDELLVSTPHTELVVVQLRARGAPPGLVLL